MLSGSVEHVDPPQHVDALTPVDRHIAEAPMRAGATCLRLAHGLRDRSEVEFTWLILESDGDSFDDDTRAFKRSEGRV
jgi:hypothetical protein